MLLRHDSGRFFYDWYLDAEVGPEEQEHQHSNRWVGLLTPATSRRAVQSVLPQPECLRPGAGPDARARHALRLQPDGVPGA
jgi:hypothetical protein